MNEKFDSNAFDDQAFYDRVSRQARVRKLRKYVPFKKISLNEFLQARDEVKG